jgi:hypothetical protein
MCRRLLAAAALTCLGSLSVYHHHYDISAVLVPLIMLAVLYRNGELELPKSVLILAAPLAAMVTLLPVAMGQRLLTSIGGPAAGGFMNIAFPISITMALIASCLLIRQLRPRSE